MAKKKNGTAPDIDGDVVRITMLRNTPPPPRTRASSSIYDWASIGTKDPMFVEGKAVKTFASTAYAAGKRLGLKFTVRPYTLDGVDGVGVWLVES